MVFRVRGEISQVKDKMLTITNLIKESFSFLLLLVELQVKTLDKDTTHYRHST